MVSQPSPETLPACANAARIRNNQRRSRARRKEYIQELEDKIRMYEQQGVQVAKEIQEAARAVVEENKMLKAELESLRNQRSMSTKLNGGGDLFFSALGSGEHLKSHSSQLGQYLRNTAPSIEESLWDKPRGAPVVDEGSSTIRNDDITVNEQNNPGKNIPNPVVTNGEFAAHHQELKRTFPNQMETNIEFPSSMSEGLSEENDTSSCAFAVEVLTNMRAGVTVEDVRADLGCTSDFDQCSVKHSTLFNAVDRYT
ncbi:MAG: hypothetical protein Q9195_009163 [Heterodermia aff. obscurata]